MTKMNTLETLQNKTNQTLPMKDKMNESFTVIPFSWTKVMKASANIHLPT